MSTPTFPEAFAEVVSEGGPTPALVRRVFDAILAGAWTPVQVAGFAVALRMRGESPATLRAAAESLRAAMVPVEHGLPQVLDTCGTGGDGHGTLNLSTGAAVLVAAVGVPVAKHGNRAVSSRAGSADVLEALGVRLELAPERAAALLRSLGITFLMAPLHHPALRHGGQARRELGIRTLFNALGPLANPARATHQLLGAYDDSLRATLARVLDGLGVERAWVVRGEDGLDEVSPTGPTRVTELQKGAISERRVHPEDFGLAPLPAEAVAGGDAAHNARVLRAVLDGERHPATDAFVLNAAAALVVARGTAPRDAAGEVREAIASGRARQLLARWIEATRA